KVNHSLPEPLRVVWIRRDRSNFNVRAKPTFTAMTLRCGRGGMSMADDNISDTSPSKRAAPRLSIRARLMLLALLAVVPLTLDRVRLLESTRTERTEMAASEAIDLAKRGAGAQLEMINSTRAVLEVVARAYITLARSGQDCSTFLAGFVIDV